jgi:serine/threonine-protein kinase RsbW
MDVKFCLVFPREALSVPVIRRVLGDTLRTIGVDEDSVTDILLAVTEACTNVLRHSGPTRRYEVTASVDKAGCLVEVVDHGRGFDPPRARKAHAAGRPAPRPAARHARWSARTARDRAARDRAAQATATRTARTDGPESPDIAQLPESGRGLAIMRACVDNVTLQSGPGQGTVVSMRKRVGWRTDAPLTHLPAAG